MKRCMSCEQPYPSYRYQCNKCGYQPACLDGYPAYAPELARESSGYDEALFATMAEVEATNFWFTSRNKLIKYAISRHILAPTSIMEIGCGTGFVLSELAMHFPLASIQGSEIFSEGLRHASARLPQAILMQMDARSIPFDREFEVLGAFDVLEHIEEDFEALSQMYQALVPGGLLIVTVPQHPWLWSPADDYAHHVRRYTSGEIRSKVSDAGFDILQDTSFVSLLLPLMLVSRVLSRRSWRTFDPSTELRQHAALNCVLEKMMTLERIMIRAGVSFPLGGSRLLVARRPRPDRSGSIAQE